MATECLTIPLQKQAKILEEERESIIIEEEDSVENYYSLLQQYKALKKDIRDIVFSPKHCLPFLQPGRLVSIQCTKNDENSSSFCVKDEITWGVIINFERVKGASEGEMASICLEIYISLQFLIFGIIVALR